jgi:hypothetical protein
VEERINMREGKNRSEEDKTREKRKRTEEKEGNRERYSKRGTEITGHQNLQHYKR